MPFLRRALPVLVLAVAAPALPVVATPEGPPVVSALVRTAALTVGETTTAVSGERLVGVTWSSGTPAVALRWRTPQGWTAWDVAEQDGDTTEAAERVGTRPGTEPVWRPAGADLVQVRVAGVARDVQLVRVLDGVAAATSSRLGLASAQAATSVGAMGVVRSRADWGADESIREGRPSYASSVKAVVAHHTVQANDYTAAEVPALIRADYSYHVKARGWGDIGYNLIVDRFGRIWEGRAGGIGRPVVGAHAQGFNTGTLGVAVLGDLSRTTPSPAVTAAMTRITRWAGATWKWDPRGTVALTSKGSPKYASGRTATLPRLFGHQQTGSTACPGSLQGKLAGIRTAAAVPVVAPRLLSLKVTGAPVHLPTPMVVDARLSTAAPWSVVVTDPQGRSVVAASGTSAAPRLRWDGFTPAGGIGGQSGAAGVPAAPVPLPALPGSYRWTLRVDNRVHAAIVRTAAFEVGLPVVPA